MPIEPLASLKYETDVSDALVRPVCPVHNFDLVPEDIEEDVPVTALVYEPRSGIYQWDLSYWFCPSYNEDPDAYTGECAEHWQVYVTPNRFK